MQKVEYQNNVDSKIKKIYTKKHHDTIEDLEKLLEKGVPNLTMSEIASRLKISLRTLYEIAPSKDQLILMTMDKILIKLGKFALDSVSEIQSPIEKLEQYLFIVNQAVGPKFNTFLKDIEKINGSQKMADYHESFISNYTQKLLNDAISLQEAGAFSILMECVPAKIASVINEKLDVPTISYGSGPSLDAQGLVGADILGLFDLFQPKFSKRYSEIGLEIKKAFRRYHDEVISQKFPYTDNQYNVPEIVLKNFLSWIKNN